MRSLGIDVGGTRKGFDAVLLDETLVPLETERRLDAATLGALIERTKPDVVAIDAPPSWGLHGGSRLTEAEIRRFGIQCYGTPSDPKKAENAFYDWMRCGFDAFAAASAAGYERYRNGSVRKTAAEVYPHASAVVLAGCLPPAASRKRPWREGVLRSKGVETDDLRSGDQVDACLAALTGLLALRGQRFAPGDPAEGVIVLPVSSMPARPFRRCEAETVPDAQQHLPRMRPCRCGDPGCVAMTDREFAPGHDAKRKSLLWRQARVGEDALRELRRRNWEAPPELR